MANEEHLAILRQGVAAWNAWRKEHPDKVPDLREANLNQADLRRANLTAGNLTGGNLSVADFRRANLSFANLRGANLRGANFHEANLREANFRGARLGGANLIGVNLSEADLRGANLDGANLRGADLRVADVGGAGLTGANLHGVHLGGTNLTGAKLGNADFREALLYETAFGNVDLSATNGLDTCRHLGPSVIDIRTLQRSGRLPLTFLRGCGLPDRLIDYLPSLLEEAIQYYSCFISYSSKDDAFAKRLHADLQNTRVRCWFAPHDLPIGAKTWDAIDAAIRVRDKLLLILSKSAIASDWVEDEVSKAFAEERRRGQVVLFPVRIDETVMTTSEPWAMKLRDQRNIGDFCRWKDHDAYQQAFDRVLRDLKAASG
jgi:hypothetical protein